MSSFSEGFLDAPLLSTQIGNLFRLLQGSSAVEKTVSSLTDNELANIGLSRNDLLKSTHTR